MMRRDVGLESVLRRALGRAGIATGWRHVCRKKGCGHFEHAPNAALRRCPKDGRKLWPKPKVRPIRFHDIRHSTASLLMMAGGNPAAVQRILRHSDPRLTTEVYGHLAPEYLRAEVDRLSFGALASVEAEDVAQAANSPSFVPVVSPNRDPSGRTAETGGISPTISAQSTTRSTGLEPVTSGVTGRRSNQLN